MSENKQPIFEVSLDEVLHNSMMPYAEHVILDRALPRVEDSAAFCTRCTSSG